MLHPQLVSVGMHPCFGMLRRDNGLEPTEVRHGKTKLFFATYAAGDARPDFRLNLTGTRQHGAGDAQVGAPRPWQRENMHPTGARRTRLLLSPCSCAAALNACKL